MNPTAEEFNEPTDSPELADSPESPAPEPESAAAPPEMTTLATLADHELTQSVQQTSGNT